MSLFAKYVLEHARLDPELVQTFLKKIGDERIDDAGLTALPDQVLQDAIGMRYGDISKFRRAMDEILEETQVDENQPFQLSNILCVVEAKYGDPRAQKSFNVTDIVEKHRQESEDEYIKAANEPFGDPAPGTRKVLRVKYCLEPGVCKCDHCHGSGQKQIPFQIWTSPCGRCSGRGSLQKENQPRQNKRIEEFEKGSEKAAVEGGRGSLQKENQPRQNKWVEKIEKECEKAVIKEGAKEAAHDGLNMGCGCAAKLWGYANITGSLSDGKTDDAASKAEKKINSVDAGREVSEHDPTKAVDEPDHHTRNHEKDQPADPPEDDQTVDEPDDQPEKDQPVDDDDEDDDNEDDDNEDDYDDDEDDDN